LAITDKTLEEKLMLYRQQQTAAAQNSKLEL